MLMTHTSKHRPIDVVIEFSDERRVLAFEHYLKSGSGVRSPIGICGKGLRSKSESPRSRHKSLAVVSDPEQ